MRRVITYGTFDLLHWGHIRLLKRAKLQGDYLVVALSTDEFNKKKGKASYHTYEQRKMMLEAIRYVDLVIAEEDWEQKKTDVERLEIDCFVMGDDWEGEFDAILGETCDIVYLKRTEDISTSKIKKELNGSNK